MTYTPLLELAQKYGSDKAEHGYCPFYEIYLPESPVSMLEIGVAKGASALMWKDYFPNCDIHILDLFKDKDHVSARWCRESFLVPHVGDQSDTIFLGNISEQFDFILDDGSHRADHQLISLKHLFWFCLRSGGVYAIEDCHCNTNRFYDGDGLVKRYEDTALHMFKTFKETGRIINPYFEDFHAEQFATLIDRVEILSAEKLILIWRK